MGMLPGLLGLAGGVSGTGIDAPAKANLQQGVNTDETNQAYDQNQAALARQQNLLAALQGQNGLGNQSQVYGQLQGIASGAVNPAQAQFNQNTAQNVAQQAALQAGQRGANQNVGLMARNAGQQGAAISQQAAGQEATQQAQNQIAAIGAAGQMANTQAGQQIAQTNTNTAAQQSEQGNLLNALGQYNSAQVGNQSSVNAANASLAGTQMQGQQALIGGLMNSIGSAGGLLGGSSGGAGAAAAVLATGGEVEKHAIGGVVSGPQSSFGQFLAGVSAPWAPQEQLAAYPTTNTGAKVLQDGMTSMIKGKKQQPQSTGVQSGTQTAGPDSSSDVTNSSGDLSNVCAKGGMVDVVVSPGEKIVTPKEAKKVAKGGGLEAKTVPGKAKVPGDSYANDVVKTKLKPGTIVVPRSRVQNNPAGFVQETLARRGRK